MKKLYTVLFFFLSSFYTMGQEYHPLIENNKVWMIAWYNSEEVCDYYSLKTMEFSGDTVINNLVYKKTVTHGFSSDEYYCPPYELLPANINNTHFYREDIENQKVYQYIAEEEQEIVLYDFSLEVGDAIPDINFESGADYVVESIEEFSLWNGEIRRIFNLSNWGFYIEGIGGTPGFDRTLEEGLGFGASIICVRQDGQPIYQINCMNISNIEDHDFSERVNIFPNPASTKVTIDISDFYENFEAFVYDIHGRIVIEKKCFASNIIIDISALSPGIYSISGAGNNVVFNKKFLVQ